jgi:hypothetical protein
MVAMLNPNISGAVAWSDFDNNNRLDLLFGSVLVTNRGDWTFGEHDQASPSPPRSSPPWATTTRMVTSDLLYSADGSTRIYRNDGAGGATAFSDIGFRAFWPWPAPRPPGATSTTTAISTCSWPAQTLSASIATMVIIPSLKRHNWHPFPATSVAWGDYDGDGFQDVLYAGGSSFAVFHNNGNATFTPVTVPGLTTLHNAMVAWGDFDNDGRLDFAVSGSTNGTPTGGITRVYRNLGNGSFTNVYPTTPGFVGVWKGVVAWGDYDNDGDLDLLVSGEITNSIGITKIYRNDGGGIFLDSNEVLPGLRNPRRPGAISTTMATSILPSLASLPLSFPHWLRLPQFLDRPNEPAAFRAGLFQLSPGWPKSVRLTWRGASDSNQSTGLTYNVTIGTSPGSGNLLNPMAATNGWLRLPHFGNAGPRTNLTITNLPGRQLLVERPGD